MKLPNQKEFYQDSIKNTLKLTQITQQLKITLIKFIMIFIIYYKHTQKINSTTN